ncbi:iron complex outermembrane recepter protein [Sphingobium faniae]|nr:iron complex outermembrane recepter protein [Sphingobium faniae]
MKITQYAVGVAALTAWAPIAAHAQQDIPAQTSERAGTSGGIAEIVVTAQRRNERLQDIPISVNAVAGDSLAQKGITNITNLSAAVPGFDAPKVGAAATPFLRGVGSNAANPNNEPSVAMYVDGVYIGAPFVNLFSFNNIERIEVLKGPQGTLFGRNATGGVVQVITRKPSHETSVEAQAGYGNYDTISLGGYVTTGLSDTLAMDVAVQYENQMDGWGRNITLDIDNNKSREFSARSKLLFTPSDGTEITLAGDYGYNRNSKTSYHLPKGALGPDGLPHYYGRYDTDAETPSIITAKGRGLSLTIEQDVGFAKLVSITSRRLSKGRYYFDRDATNLPLVVADLYYYANNWSQEVQLIGEASQWANWQVGAFYYQSVAAYNNGNISTPDPDTGLLTTASIYGRQRTNSVSVYGQTTVTVMDGTELTGGLRYTSEKQKRKSAVNGFDFPDGKQDFNKLTWRAAINQTVTPGVKVYASYNRGVKSGGYDLLDPMSAGFRPEVLDAYEIGLKSDLFNRHVRFNAALFYYDYQDIQVSAVRNQLTATFNAAAARIKGGEFELTIAPTTGLMLTAGGAVLDGKYKDFLNPIAFGADGSIVVFPNNNAKGYDTVRAPKFTGFAGFDYMWPGMGGDFNIGANVNYNDGFVFDDVAGRLRQKAYALVNGTIGWTAKDERLGVTLWVRNLFDEYYLGQGVTGQLGDIITAADPRMYGVTLRTKF